MDSIKRRLSRKSRTPWSRARIQARDSYLAVLILGIAWLFLSSALAHSGDRLGVWMFLYDDGHYQLDLSSRHPIGPDQIDLYFDGALVPANFVAITDTPDSKPGATARIEGTYIPGGSFQWASDPRLGKTMLSVRWPESERVLGFWLKPGEPSPPIKLGDPPPPPVLDVVWSYVKQGVLHVLPDGFDHVLFIVALGLPLLSLRQRVIDVTAFTAAHSITLALVATGVLPTPPGLIEAAIAASIFVLAAENLWSEQVRQRRWLWAFGFGLLHGAGFAGAIGALGLPKHRELVALGAFNIGIELAQLLIIGCLVALAWPWRQQAQRYRAWIVRPVSAGIALMALVWVAQRLGGA